MTILHERSTMRGIRPIGIILLATCLLLLLLSVAAAGHWLSPETERPSRSRDLAVRSLQEVDTDREQRVQLIRCRGSS